MVRSKKEEPIQGPIINEVLCWAQNVINVSNELNFLNLGSVGFEEQEISRSRDLLINLLPNKDAPLLKKRVPRLASDSKSVQDLKEIYNIFQEYGKSENIPIFAAAQLDKLPPISYESPDATAMLIAFKKLENKVGLLTDSLDSSKVSTEGIINLITNVEHRLSDIETSKPRSRTVGNDLPLSCTDCGNGSLDPVNIISGMENGKIKMASPIDVNIEITLHTGDSNNDDSENKTPILESPKLRSRTNSESDQVMPFSDTDCGSDNVKNKGASSIDANIEGTGLTEDLINENSDTKKGKEIVVMNDKVHVALNEKAEVYGNSEAPFTLLQLMSLLLAMIIAPLTFFLNLCSSIAGDFWLIDNLVVSLYMLQIYVTIDEMIHAVIRPKFDNVQNVKETAKEYPYKTSKSSPTTAIILSLNGRTWLPNRYSCSECDFSTINRFVLNKHKEEHRAMVREKEGPEITYVCSVCDFKTTIKEDLYAHFLTHAGGDPDQYNVSIYAYGCQICSFKTPDKDYIYMRTFYPIRVEIGINIKALK